MFESKEKKQEKKNVKLQELMESLGVDNLADNDKAIMASILSNSCFVNYEKYLTTLSGGTTQTAANSILLDILKTNLVLVRQNDEMIKLLQKISNQQ